ncbi:TetR/AcrR family transcriptional regulator (plasmid) [Chloroflexota bacterium]|nr:TetR/AcrR family transcriptional regulator [Chloroflexota bacterium]
MPPKVKITQDAVIEAAFELVRQGGMLALNARAIASELKCSTQPIFRVFDSMDDLRAAVMVRISTAYNNYFDAQLNTEDVPPYKATGLAYIHFARDERELFKTLFMRDRTGEVQVEEDHSFDVAVERIMSATGLDREKASRFHLDMWVFVHGIATMLATSYLDLGDELISELMTDAYRGFVPLYMESE